MFSLCSTKFKWLESKNLYLEVIFTTERVTTRICYRVVFSWQVPRACARLTSWLHRLDYVNELRLTFSPATKRWQKATTQRHLIQIWRNLLSGQNKASAELFCFFIVQIRRRLIAGFSLVPIHFCFEISFRLHSDLNVAAAFKQFSLMT